MTRTLIPEISNMKYLVRFDVDGRVVSFSVTDEQTPPLRVNPGSHMTTLFVNGVPTIKNDVVVNPQEVKIVEHKGGVFRKYSTILTQELILQSMTIRNTLSGDIRKGLNINGSGAYITDLTINPASSLNKEKIATILRLFEEGSFVEGDINSVGNLEPSRAEAFLDLSINGDVFKFDTDPIFKNQYVLPNLQIIFQISPNVNEGSAVLINRN